MFTGRYPCEFQTVRDVFLSLYLKLCEFQGENSSVDWRVQRAYLSQLERQELYSQSAARFSVWQVQYLVCRAA